jgi:hypothetical protein
VKVVARAPAAKAPWSAPATPASLSISVTCMASNGVLVGCLCLMMHQARTVQPCHRGACNCFSRQASWHYQPIAVYRH